jgi:hypothetical protein
MSFATYAHDFAIHDSVLIDVQGDFNTCNVDSTERAELGAQNGPEVWSPKPHPYVCIQVSFS